MIYLTHAKTAYSTHVEYLDDLSYPQKVHWFPELYTNVKRGLTYVPHKVMEKVLDPVVVEAVKNGSGRTAFIFASGNSNLAGNSRVTKETRLSYQYKILPLTLTNIYAGRVAQSFGDIDLVQTDASACASSLKVLMDVQTLIHVYDYDRVIVLTGEDQVANSVLDFFGEAKASLLGEEGVPSAFDSKNGGFYVGQGAALAVFEKHDHMTSVPIAELKSAYAASERSTNAIGQREDGEGFIKAICGALDVANLTPTDISVVKTHGTGTESNNLSEKNALCRTLNRFIATSYKPTIGHTMGASGLLESILLIKSLRTGLVPGIRNRTEQDSVFLSEDSQVPKEGHLLSLAAGMGNIYAAAVFDWRI